MKHSWVLLTVALLYPAFVCQAQSATSLIDAYTPTSVLVSPTTVPLGTTVVLVCRVGGVASGTQLNYTWTCPNGPCDVGEGNNPNRKTYGDRMVLNVLTSRDGGTYTCQVTVVQDTVHQSSFTLNVEGGTVLSSYNRLIPNNAMIFDNGATEDTNVGDILPPEGSSSVAVIDCSTANSTQPLTWTDGAGQTVPTSLNLTVYQITNGSSTALHIDTTDTSTFTNGRYQCDGGMVRVVNIYINQGGATIATPGLQSISGGNAEVSFFLTQATAAVSERYISSLERTDLGVPLEVEFEETQSSGDLGDDIDRIVSAPGAEYIVQIWSLNGASFSGDPVTDRTRLIFDTTPSAPRLLSVTHILSDGFELNWLPPREPNGGPQYEIEHGTDDTNFTTVDTGSRDTYYNLTGLQQNTTYYIRVVAVNYYTSNGEAMRGNGSDTITGIVPDPGPSTTSTSTVQSTDGLTATGTMTSPTPTSTVIQDQTPTNTATAPSTSSTLSPTPTSIVIQDQTPTNMATAPSTSSTPSPTPTSTVIQDQTPTNMTTAPSTSSTPSPTSSSTVTPATGILNIVIPVVVVVFICAVLIVLLILVGICCASRRRQKEVNHHEKGDIPLVCYYNVEAGEKADYTEVNPTTGEYTYVASNSPSSNEYVDQNALYASADDLADENGSGDKLNNSCDRLTASTDKVDNTYAMLNADDAVSEAEVLENEHAAAYAVSQRTSDTQQPPTYSEVGEKGSSTEYAAIAAVPPSATRTPTLPSQGYATIPDKGPAEGLYDTADATPKNKDAQTTPLTDNYATIAETVKEDADGTEQSPPVPAFDPEILYTLPDKTSTDKAGGYETVPDKSVGPATGGDYEAVDMPHTTTEAAKEAEKPPEIPARPTAHHEVPDFGYDTVPETAPPVIETDYEVIDMPRTNTDAAGAEEARKLPDEPTTSRPGGAIDPGYETVPDSTPPPPVGLSPDYEVVDHTPSPSPAQGRALPAQPKGIDADVLYAEPDRTVEKREVKDRADGYALVDDQNSKGAKTTEPIHADELYSTPDMSQKKNRRTGSQGSVGGEGLKDTPPGTPTAIHPLYAAPDMSKKQRNQPHLSNGTPPDEQEGKDDDDGVSPPEVPLYQPIISNTGVNST